MKKVIPSAAALLALFSAAVTAADLAGVFSAFASPALRIYLLLFCVIAAIGAAMLVPRVRFRRFPRCVTVHAALIISGMYAVLLLADRLLPAQSFIDSCAMKLLILLLCAAALINALFARSSAKRAAAKARRRSGSRNRAA